MDVSNIGSGAGFISPLKNWTIYNLQKYRGDNASIDPKYRQDISVEMLISCLSTATEGNLQEGLKGTETSFFWLMIFVPTVSTICGGYSIYTPENLRIRPLKRDYFSREYIFQPLIFRGHVSFQGFNVDSVKFCDLITTTTIGPYMCHFSYFWQRGFFNCEMLLYTTSLGVCMATMLKEKVFSKKKTQMVVVQDGEFSSHGIPNR